MRRLILPFARSFRRLLPVLALGLMVSLALGACGDDGTGPFDRDSGELGVVLNSVDLSLTIFPVDSPGSPRPPVGLGPDGSPVSLAVRGPLAAVPMGTVPALVVVDLVAGERLRTIALPDGSGATGVAFLSDTRVLVANPNLNSVTPVNVVLGEAESAIDVGGFPQSVVASGDRVLVLNSELGPDFLPTGPGTVTVLDRSTLELSGNVTLSGRNPGAGAVGPQGFVHVVNSGNFGEGDGSLSVMDPDALLETAHHPGFGEFPFGVVFGSEGLLHVASFSYGFAVWDPATESFVRSPDDAVTPEGVPSVSGIAFDGEGRLYTLRPDCQAPSVANRLAPNFSVDVSISVGTCPIALAFTDPGGG